MRILSIQVGTPKTFLHRGKSVSTAIFKEVVSGPVMLRTLNLDGDGQADLTVHGGPDKALYAYGFDAYPAWQNLRPQDQFTYGALGENLTFDTLPEDQLCIGDTFALGDSQVQVAQPRFPCYKLAVKFDDPKILKQFMQLKRTGVYFRVLQEGRINVGDELRPLQQEPVRLSVTELFDLAQQPHIAPKRLQEILTIRGLPPQWREEFESQLAP
jgi:MOSC domain-containing protein YiiM